MPLRSPSTIVRWTLNTTKRLALLLVVLLAASPAAAQQPINWLQLAGTAVDVNSGNKSAGTLRVVLATDQPDGGFFQTTATNNALTTGQMGAFQLTAQRALFTNLRNASGTEMGTTSNPLQVTLANTGANSNKLLVTPDSVALPANQSVNVSQINGGPRWSSVPSRCRRSASRDRPSPSRPAARTA
jgi:hypothetical protein